jgi:MFS family permease
MIELSQAMPEKRHSYYRWYLLAVTMASYGVITGLNRLCMPVLFTEISADIHLSVVAVGTVWGMDPLAGVFTGLPSGVLADRFGVKKSLIILCILAGIFGALRGFSINFVTMAASMFLFGLTAAATPSVVPKMTAEWFSGREISLANSFINVAWALCAMFATMLSATVISPAIGGWRHVLFIFGIPAVIMGLMWMFTGREPVKHELATTLPAAEAPFRESLGHVLRIKQVWVLGLINMTTWGATTGLIGYLPLYLEGQGWSVVAADSTVTAIAGIGMVGAIPTVIIAERTSRKGMITLAFAALALSVSLIPLVSVTGVWLLLVFGCLIRAGSQAVLTAVIFETKGVGSKYGGTAVGLTNSIGMLGAFLAPPIGNSLTAFSAGSPMFFWGALAAAALPLLYMIKFKHAPAQSV